MVTVVLHMAVEREAFMANHTKVTCPLVHHMTTLLLLLLEDLLDLLSMVAIPQSEEVWASMVELDHLNRPRPLKH